MRKIILCTLILSLVFAYARCEDNLLAVDVAKPKQETAVNENKTIQNDDATNKSPGPALQEQKSEEEQDKGLKKIQAYRDFIETKQKEIEGIKLDLEKSDLLLKKKEAEKQIYEIEKALPQSGKEETMDASSLHEAKQSSIERSDIKILLLLISDSLKEGIVSLKGVPYGFKEGESIASKLTADKIEPDGITFRQDDGAAFKLIFIN